jgi:hypothetical protein
MRFLMKTMTTISTKKPHGVFNFFFLLFFKTLLLDYNILITEGYKQQTPPPPYFVWNSTIDTVRRYTISYGNIAQTKKEKDRIHYNYLNISKKGVVLN